MTAFKMADEIARNLAAPPLLKLSPWTECLLNMAVQYLITRGYLDSVRVPIRTGFILLEESRLEYKQK